MAKPSFWEDNRRAQEVIRERTELSRPVARLKELTSNADDLTVLLELAEEANDGSVDAEIADSIASLTKDLDEFELKIMLSGPHDTKAAIVSIHPGAGGTESQDWAQMLLRMYLRWCERAGLKAEVVEKKQREELAELTGQKKEIAFGSQIRSYTFHPYQLIKDHRTGLEVGNVDGVMDGDLDAFIKAYLLWARGRET